MSSDIQAFLSRLSAQLPKELSNYPNEFLQLHEGRLWHQLTMSLESFANHQSAQKELPALYNGFITKIQQFISPFSFTLLTTKIARLVPVKDAVGIFEKLADDYKGKGQAEFKAAYILVLIEWAHYKLIAGDSPGSIALVSQVKPLIDAMMGLNPLIHASYFKVSAEIARKSGDHGVQYHSIISYLSLIDTASLGVDEARQWAREVIVSALLAKDIYNFGELLGHLAVLQVLKTTDDSFLLDLVDAFNSGNFGAVEQLSNNISKHSLLASHLDFLSNKLRLMALAEGLFKVLQVACVVPFEQVSAICKTPTDSVELVLLEAIALGIITGRIDQVKQTFYIESVQPRFLNVSQIGDLKTAFESWSGHVQSAITFISQNLPNGLSIQTE